MATLIVALDHPIICQSCIKVLCILLGLGLCVEVGRICPEERQKGLREAILATWQL